MILEFNLLIKKCHYTIYQDFDSHEEKAHVRIMLYNNASVTIGTICMNPTELCVKTSQVKQTFYHSMPVFIMKSSVYVCSTVSNEIELFPQTPALLMGNINQNIQS